MLQWKLKDDDDEDEDGALTLCSLHISSSFMVGVGSQRVKEISTQKIAIFWDVIAFERYVLSVCRAEDGSCTFLQNVRNDVPD
jgi:hypothetical protein